MSTLYGIVSIVSILLLVLYFIIDKKRDLWLMLLFISVSVCNAGYFFISVSSTVAEAVLANKLAYLGNVFLPYFMFMITLKVCKIKVNKIVVISLLVLGIAVLLIATSYPHLKIYYTDVYLEEITSGLKGVALKKKYGVLHNLYFVYLFGYIISMLAVIIFAICKKKLTSKMHAIFLFAILFGNVAVWLIEQFISHNFEFLSVSYILNETLLILLYETLNEYKVFDSQFRGGVLAEPEVQQDTGYFSEQDINIIFANMPLISTLTTREKEVVKLIFKGEKRKDIASILFITESAVKKHTSNIFKKIQVENRAQLYEQCKKYIN